MRPAAMGIQMKNEIIRRNIQSKVAKLQEALRSERERIDFRMATVNRLAHKLAIGESADLLTLPRMDFSDTALVLSHKIDTLIMALVEVEE